jgi:hypothetical protein
MVKTGALILSPIAPGDEVGTNNLLVSSKVFNNWLVIFSGFILACGSWVLKCCAAISLNKLKYTVVNYFN